MIFNKPVKTKDIFNKIKEKIQNQLGYYKHPRDLVKKDIDWLKKNIKQFDKKVLDKIINDSVKSDKPKSLRS
jgi:hypothetical protein